jgi:hypothetical protein
MEERILDIIKENAPAIIWGEPEKAAEQINILFTDFAQWLSFGPHPFILGSEYWYMPTPEGGIEPYSIKDLFNYWLKVK